MSALLPCPFCGAAAEYAEGMDEGGRFFAVQCSGCGCGSGKHYPLMDDARPNAANEWNRRAPPPLPTREALIAAIAPVWDRMTQPGQVKLSDLCGDAADAVLRLLREEETQ